MRGAQRDGNEAGIITALVGDGNGVEQVDSVDGHPDLTVWAHRLSCFVLMEVKDPKQKPNKRRLTEKQQEWWARNAAAVAAGRVVKVETVDEAFAAVGRL